MALDHRKINQAWKKNQADFFCVRQVYFTKSCQQIRVYGVHLRTKIIENEI